MTKNRIPPIIVYIYLYVPITMVDRIDGKNDSQEKAKQGPAVDVEVKNAAVAAKIDQEFSKYIENQNDWKESMQALNKESTALHKGIFETIEQQFEAQISSGDIIKVLNDLQNDITTNGPDAARRNRGAGLIIPVQLVLREAGYAIDADGMDGPKTRAALNKFQKDHGLKITPDFTIDVAMIAALREEYVKNYKETTRFAPSAEKLQQLKNQKYKSALMNYFVNSPLTQIPLDNMFTRQEMADLSSIYNIKKLAFGWSPSRMRKDMHPERFDKNGNPKSRLDLTKFDADKNSKINVVVYNNL